MSQTGNLEQRYDVLDVLGSGVGGTARLVRRKHTGQEYVAKEAAAGMQEILAELEMMKLMRHPNCAKMVEFCVYTSALEERALTICEYARGGDLSAYLQDALKQGGLPEEMTAGIFRHAMSGVAFLHAAGCVHNDLKPENLLAIDRYEPDVVPRIVITDFGCATLSTNPKVVFGDPRYSSPENLQALVDYNEQRDTPGFQVRPEGDIWAMGVTLYELLSDGMLPFLYEPCSRDDLLAAYEKLKTLLLEPADVDVCPPRKASERAAAVLKMILRKDACERTTASMLLEDPWLRRAPTSETRWVEFAAQPDAACQILLTTVMWRLQFCHLERCREIFDFFDASRVGRVSREQFKRAFPQDLLNADRVFDRADVNGDDSLEFNEFAAICFEWHTLDDQTLDVHIQELLIDISANHDGNVEQLDMLTYFGGTVAEDDIANLFAKRIGVEGYLSAPAVRDFVRQGCSNRLVISCDLLING